MMVQHFCITICTRERPEMLWTCLASVLPQLASSIHQTSIIVVENSAAPSCGHVVRRFKESYPSVPLNYLVEPELGIPIARNTALDGAMALIPDWIVFIDDDEEACDGWFEQLIAAADRWDADVIHAPVELIYPPECPAWMRMKQFHGGEDGTIISSAATGNTLARSWLFSETGLGLRFDTQLRFTGGSDVDLFFRATQGGATIRWINNAVVMEHVPAARQSAKWLLQRAQRNAANTVTLTLKQRGFFSAMALSLRNAVRLSLEAIGSLCLVIVFLTRSDRLSPRIFKLRKKIAKLKGYLTPLFGYSVEPYRHVEGR